MDDQPTPYLNGIAIAVIELKRSSVEVADGVRQLVTNQKESFNQGFFSAVQLVLAAAMRRGCAMFQPRELDRHPLKLRTSLPAQRTGDA